MKQRNVTEFIRVDKTKNYTVIHNQFLRRKDLSWKAKGILAYILSLPDDWNINLKEVMTHATEGERAFRSGWEELSKLGYVERKPVRKGNRIVHWETIVRENVDVKAFPELCGFEDVQNVHVRNEDVQNSNLLSTNSTKDLNELRTNKTYGQIEHFNEFWEAYPNKKNKKKAKDKYLKDVDKELHQTIMKDLKTRKKSKDWTKDNGKYIPHPTTYLNGERWNDEIETNANTSRYDLPIL